MSDEPPSISGVKLIRRCWQCRFGRHRWEPCVDTRGRTFRHCFHCGKDDRG